VVGTGVADVFALTGTFVVSSAGPESARVDIKKGNVEVVRVGSRAPFPMSAGGAFFQADLAKVVTESGLRIDRKPTRTLPFPGPQDAVFSENGRDVWVASARQFTLWTRDGGTADKLFPPRKGFDRAVFTRDRAALVFLNPKEEKVLVRDLPGDEERGVIDLKLPESRLWTVAPDAAWFAVAEPKPNHKRLRVVDGRTGAERYAREFEEPIGCLAATPDGNGLAVGLADVGRGLNGKVLLLDAAIGDRLVALPTQKRGQMSLAFSADGRHLAVGFNGLVQVWDTRTRELVRSITGFERVPTCLAFSADGKTLAAGTQDGQVWVWSAATGRPRQLIEVGTRGVRSVAFDRDGKRLVTVASNAPIALWDVAEDDMQ
jgi:WD40 repeat protein